MSMPQSNNPFRASMLPTPEEQTSTPLSAPALPPQARPGLYKSPSTTTTIAEDHRFSQESCQAELANATTVTASENSLSMEMSTIQNKKGDGEVVVMVHNTSSSTTVPTVTSPPRPSMACGGDRRSMRCSMQIEEGGMWPARKMLQKQQADKKRMWIWIKVAIALVIIGGAVAIGLGISKAVKK